MNVLQKTGQDFPARTSRLSRRTPSDDASDAETLWSLIASLAVDNGAPSDPAALRDDRVDQRLLGLGQVNLCVTLTLFVQLI